jgi:hypothetical protein
MLENNRKKNMRTCFISAPYGYKTSELVSALEHRKIKGVLATDIMELQGLLTAHIASAIKSCDITLCIAETSDDLKNRLFELGIAFGMGKNVILVASYDAGEIPLNSSEIPFLRLPSYQVEEISDHVKEVLEYGRKTPIRKKYTFTPSRPIGNYVVRLLERFQDINQRYQSSKRYRPLVKDVEKLVSDAIIKSGVNVVSGFTSRYSHPDLAIWSDELSPYMANPLIVEVKGIIRNNSDLNKASEQLIKFINETNSKFGLLVYFDGKKVSQMKHNLPSYILVISVKELINSLANNSFGEIVKKLRNERIHGIGD